MEVQTQAPTSTHLQPRQSTSAVVEQPSTVSSTYGHTCAILDNGEARCWGRDNHGQLGDGGSNTDQSSPVAVSGSNTWDSSTGLSSGSGSGSSSTSSFAYANNKVSAGNQHTCAILDNGDLKCWGYDYFGQLGDGGSNTDVYDPPSTAIDLGAGRTAVAVSAGMSHTCAILDNGDLKCWGRDNNGQLGDGGSSADTNEPSSTAIDFGTGRTAVAVSAGDYHTCAILDNGDLKCWGHDHYGQLGNGGSSNTDAYAPSSTAINLGTGRTAVAVSAGMHHTCAILDNGDLKCWGYDYYGQLGDGGGNTDAYAPSSTAIDLGTGRTANGVCRNIPHLRHP